MSPINTTEPEEKEIEKDIYRLSQLYAEDNFEIESGEKNNNAVNALQECSKKYFKSDILDICIFLLIVILIVELAFIGRYYYKLHKRNVVAKENHSVYHNADFINIDLDYLVIESQKNPSKEQHIFSEEELSDIDKLKIDYNNINITGYIKIYDTKIDYPVLHAKNNIFYKQHDEYKTPNTIGSIYMDCNNSDFLNSNTIIYGSNITTDSMFYNLKNFHNESFYENHKYINITSELQTYIWEVFSYHEGDINCLKTSFKNDKEFIAFQENILKNSIHSTNINISTENRILTLVSYNDNDDLDFVVHAKLINS